MYLTFTAYEHIVCVDFCILELDKIKEQLIGSNTELRQRFNRQRSTTVSYTHLDVYKRQVIMRGVRSNDTLNSELNTRME